MPEAARKADESCFHCGLPVPANEEIEETLAGAPRRFCCIGCRAVCSAIYEAGLEGFYQRTPEGTLLAPPPPPPPDAEIYDLDEIQADFVSDLGQMREVNLLVEGIHCAACVWLIERTLGKMDGVVGAAVNLANKRLHIRWDNDKATLATIINRLSQIGYAAVPFDPEVAEGAIKKQNRAFLFRLGFAAFTMMNLLWISIALYTGASHGEFRSMFHWVGFALATPTLFYAGWPFLRGAFTGLRRLHLTMDLPIAIGATTTWGYSSYVTITGAPHGVYFDTVVNFLFVILIGRFLESISKRNAVSSTQRLLDLQPRVATLLVEGDTKVVPIRSVKPGDVVLVKAGDKVPVDGTVLEGRSTVDESMLTGESVPVGKTLEDRVSAGTINVASALTVRVDGILANTALGRIITLVEEAQASKAPIQTIADRIVPWFVAVTLLLGAATFALWWHVGVEHALIAATAVLIITCPCAFGLATPMAIAVASGLGARNGILVKNGEVLETLSHINHFVFDKTGTLTEGQMRLQRVLTEGMDEETLLGSAAALERYSEHAIARAIVEAAEKRGLDASARVTRDFESVPGHGVRGDIDGTALVVGTEAWLAENGIIPVDRLLAQVRELESAGMSCVHAAENGRHCGVLAVADQLRPDALDLVASLRRAGMRLTLLSGDRQRVAEAVAEQLGGGLEVIAEVMPADKDRVISELQAHGGRIAMVGDGVNDAPALIRADVGIALGSGTDVSMESADLVLISNELDNIRVASELSRRTLRTIRQNIGISILYNVIMVPLAMAAFVTPLVAALSMPVSSLLVITNAARIRTLFTKQGLKT